MIDWVFNGLIYICLLSYFFFKYLVGNKLDKLEKEKEKLPYNEKKKTRENNYRAEYYEKITNLRVSAEFLNNEYYKSRVKKLY